MKVGLVCPYDLDVPGGVQQHVRRLADELRVLGDEVLVVAAGDPRVAEEGVVRVGRSSRVRFNGAVAPVALGPGVPRRVARALGELEPDVVHVHEPLVARVGPSAVAAATAPLVATFHAYADRARLYRLARPYTRRVVASLDDRIAVSRAAAGFHADAIGCRADEFTIVANGVDVDRFARARESVASEQLTSRDAWTTLLFVGRIERRKGLAPLIRAFVRIRRERDDVRLVVIGDGPRRRRCESLVPSALAGDVEFLGRVDDRTLAEWYARSDVCVVPALGGESFGMVLLEAMAAGTAVVASDLPGFREVLENGRCGVLVLPGDDGELARAILRLVSDAVERTQLADVAREHARTYDWSNVADRVRSRYLDAVARDA